MSHCVVNFEVAEALVQAVFRREREAKYLDNKELIPCKRAITIRSIWVVSSPRRRAL